MSADSLARAGTEGRPAPCPRERIDGNPIPLAWRQEWTRDLARPQPVQQVEPSTRWFIVRLEGEHFAWPAAEVLRSHVPGPSHALPGRAHTLVGSLMQLEGNLVLHVRLDRLLGIEVDASSTSRGKNIQSAKSARISRNATGTGSAISAISSTRDAASSDRRGPSLDFQRVLVVAAQPAPYAFSVDAVIGLCSLRASSLQPAPRHLPARLQGLVHGLWRDEVGLSVTLLDSRSVRDRLDKDLA